MGKASSKNWIFLRGLSRESAHWGDFPAAFEKRFAGTKVFPIDLPGNGEYCNTSTPLTLKGLAEFVRMYITDPDKAARVAPTFLPWFEARQFPGQNSTVGCGSRFGARDRDARGKSIANNDLMNR